MTGWSKLGRFLKENHLLNESTRWIGLSFDDPAFTNQEHCWFYACASIASPIKPQGEIGSLTIREGHFAVYTHNGSYDGLLNLYKTIYSQIEYTLRDSISFEEYINSPHNTKTEDLTTKVFIPIE